MHETIAAPAPANFIAGEWSPGAGNRTYERVNPWRPTETVGRFPSSTAEDVAAAVDAAEQARTEWARLPAAKRCAFLAGAAARIEARVEEIAQDMTREMGKPLRESRMEAARAAAIFRFFSGEGWRPVGEVFEQSLTGATVHTRRRPVGVVALITPWNFPAAADPDAYLIAPTLFEGVGDDAFLSCEEVFGPVTSLYRFTTLDEAIERANAVRFGLSASVFTSSLATAERCVNELEAGILHVNSQTAGADVHVPFGGTKGSGYGPHEQGRAAIEFYTEEITVYRDV